MLILPIINRGRVMNVELKLKNVSKIREKVHYKGAGESEIIVNREKFSNSIFQKEKEENAPVDFIRSKSILYPRNFLVTTKEENTSDRYDVYEVSQPPKKVNDALDKLYGKAIIDMQKEIPNTSRRGRYVSFEKLGMGECLTEENLAKLKKIVQEEKEKEKWDALFQKEGVLALKEMILFLQEFECRVIPSTTIKESSIQDTLKSLEVLNTRDYRNLKSYYDIAKSNQEIYTKLSYIHQMIWDKPLHLITSPKEEKPWIKKKEEKDYAEVA